MSCKILSGQNVQVEIARSIVLFVAAGVAEIGGGYLVWRWLREGAPWWAGLIGASSLVGITANPMIEPDAYNKQLRQEIVDNAALVTAAGIPIGGAQ